MNLRKDIVRIVLVTALEFIFCAAVGVLFALLFIANLDAALPPALPAVARQTAGQTPAAEHGGTVP